MVSIKKFKLTSAFTATVILLSIAFGTVEADPASPDIFVNGANTLENAIIYDGRPYVPLSAISDSAGLSVSFEQNAGKIEINSISNDEKIPEVIRKVSPSVVAIVANDDKNNIWHGSGVIIKQTGEILTNAHVTKDSKTILVVMADGNAYSAKLKNIDEKSDLAVIKIEKNGLTAAKFASVDKVVVGKSVIAIGAPLSVSLRNSASMGIISGIGRGLDTYDGYALIQSDAAINGGNSGGPLVNMSGEVVGINTIKYSGTGIENIGFSVSIDTIQYVLSHFDKYGAVIRPEFGCDFEEGWAARMGLPSKEGLTVKRIVSGSLAQKSGFRDGDIIVSIGGTVINSKVDFNECMKKYLPGDSSEVVLKRNGTPAQITINY